MIEDQKIIIYNSLLEKYNITINKKELAEILGCSTSFLDKGIVTGSNIPSYKKVGSKVIFNLLDVASYLVDTTPIHY